MSTKRAFTLRHGLTVAVALAGVASAAGAPAATMEEVIAHGSIAAARERQAYLEAEMASFVRDVERELAASARQRLEQAAPSVRLAQSAESHRG